MHGGQGRPLLPSSLLGSLRPFAQKVSGWEPPGCAPGRHEGALVSLNTWLSLHPGKGWMGEGCVLAGEGGRGDEPG